MDAIHSLQLILRGSLQDEVADESKMIVTVPSVNDRIQRVDELRIVTNEMVRLIETAAVPIFAVDSSGNINGWNSKAAELTGLTVEHANANLVEDDSIDIVKNMLSLALEGDSGIYLLNLLLIRLYFLFCVEIIFMLTD